MTTFTITIKNNSDTPKSFLLFQDLPEPSNTPSDQVFTHVYQSAPPIAPDTDSSVTFSMNSECFAFIGTSSRREDGNVKVTATNSVPAKLGPNGSYFVVSTQDREGEVPVFDEDSAADMRTPANGGFTVATDSSFRFPHSRNFYLGCGAQDPIDPNKVVPIQTYTAQPNLLVQVFPTAKYFIAVGKYPLGTIVDRNVLGPVLKVDFTKCGTPEASFTLNNREQYEADESVQRNGVMWEFSRRAGF